MKIANKLTAGLCLFLIILLTQAQPAYRSAGPASVQAVQMDNVDLRGGTLPSDSVRGRKAGMSRLTYTLEPKGVNNFAQFGTGKYYAKNFRFALDWYGHLSVSERRKYGINAFNYWSIKEGQRSQLQPGEGIFYWTQNNLGELQHPVQFHCYDLQTFLNKAWPIVPTMGYGEWTNFRYWVMDLETAVFAVMPGQHKGEPLPGFDGGYFDDWGYWKDRPFVLEGSAGTTTLARLAAQGRGAWNYEMETRRANRMNLLLEIAKKKGAPGTKVSAGFSPWIGRPSLGAGPTDTFFPGNGRVSTIGGDDQGTITLTIPDRGGIPWPVNLSGDALKHQDFLQGYYYEDHPEFSETDANEIFVQKKAGTQNYPYLWSKIRVEPVVAFNKGWIQQNRQIVQKRTGQSYKQPLMRQVEPVYEWGQQRVPFAELQNIIRYNNPAYRDTPRLWVPPYLQYSIYVVTRFFAGNEPDWGFYLFPIDPPDVTRDPAKAEPIEGKMYYGHELHPITSLLQARADLQPYETYFDGSTLVEDPEVKINQTGDWSAYSGVEALNYNAGVQRPVKPAYMLRYKPVKGGWWVLIMGGMPQGWTEERTDLVRVPGGLLNGNQFKVRLRGPSAQVYEFMVKSSDRNQTYEALPVGPATWEKPGYAGRVGAKPGS